MGYTTQSRETCLKRNGHCKCTRSELFHNKKVSKVSWNPNDFGYSWALRRSVVVKIATKVILAEVSAVVAKCRDFRSSIGCFIKPQLEYCNPTSFHVFTTDNYCLHRVL